MRRKEFVLDRQGAIALLSRAEVVHVATTTPLGVPLLRTLNSVVVRDWLLFHGARAGEKSESLGRAAVVSAEEIVANVPSYFIDAERACPATTYYDSVQVHGPIEELHEPELKAEMLAAFMRKYQPEGGYTELSATSPLYERAIRGVVVFGVRLDSVSGKGKCGQNRSSAELQAVVTRLWERGAARDARAVQRIFDANPKLLRPELFMGPESTLLEPALDERALSAAVNLLAGQYWNRGLSADDIGRAQLGSAAWVGARTHDGELIATARAISDGARHALVADVAVKPEFRGKGLGKALMRLLISHPVVRNVELVRLGTADAQSFYRGLGFFDAAELDVGFRSTPMLLLRSQRYARAAREKMERASGEP